VNVGVFILGITPECPYFEMELAPFVPANASKRLLSTSAAGRPTKVSTTSLSLKNRSVATTRIVFPKAKVRLSAGRSTLTHEAQAFCFYVGSNSIFYGTGY